MAHIHVIGGAQDRVQHPAIRKIDTGDLWEALRSGYEDFAAMPTHALFVALIYPIVGVMLAGLVFGANMLPMLFPLAAGFALVGPIAAIGLYELSRQREAGREPDLAHVFDVTKSPSFPAILALNGILFVMFFAWLASAQTLYQSLFGYAAPASAQQFLTDLFTTREGFLLIALGNGIGLGFAIAAFVVSVISFPMLLDRDCGLAAAIITSLRAVAANPAIMALWGLIVAALLVIGSLPCFIGLAVVIPLLGHATWHLYRKLVARPL